MAKCGERGGLEYGRGLLHSTHLHREGAVSYRIVPSIGNWEGRRGVEEMNEEQKGGREAKMEGGRKD